MGNANTPKRVVASEAKNVTLRAPFTSESCPRTHTCTFCPGSTRPLIYDSYRTAESFQRYDSVLRARALKGSWCTCAGVESAPPDADTSLTTQNASSREQAKKDSAHSVSRSGSCLTRTIISIAACVKTMNQTVSDDIEFTLVA